MLLRTFTLLAFFFIPFISQADMEWSGVYRFEGVLLDNPSLIKNGGDSKDYATHHLVLKPKMIVADGFEINARFDGFNGATDQNVHPNNQIGNAFGASSSNNDQYYSSAAGNAGADIIEITQAYLTYSHNFGALIVGRAPVHFGLGMSYDSGDDLFDHWYDTRDLIGFKVHFGNIYVFPMYAKLNEGAIGRKSSDAEDLRFQAEYDNKDKDIKLGFLFSEKKAKANNHDYPVLIDNATYSRANDLKIRSLSFYLKKDLENLDYGLEFSYVSGDTGLVNTSGQEVDIQAFGIAAELDYEMPKHSLSFGLRAGYASGDDKQTNDKVEGFIFNRNYDVGMLLFNHPLGQQDLLGVQSFLRKGYGVNNPATPNSSRLEDFDVESISNVFYIAPSVKYDINDKINIKSTFITGFLVEDAQGFTDMDTALGYELDLSVSYQPIKRVHLMLQGAALLPGSAFEAGNVDSKFTYGLMGKAAVNF